MTGAIVCLAFAFLLLIRQPLYERFWIHRHLGLGSGLVGPASVLFLLYILAIVASNAISFEPTTQSGNSDSAASSMELSEPIISSSSLQNHITETVSMLSSFSGEITSTSQSSPTNSLSSISGILQSAIISSTSDTEEQSSIVSNQSSSGRPLWLIFFPFIHLGGALSVGLLVLARLFILFEESKQSDATNTHGFVKRPDWVWKQDELNPPRIEKWIERIAIPAWGTNPTKPDQIATLKWNSSAGTLTISIKEGEVGRIPKPESSSAPAQDRADEKQTQNGANEKNEWKWDGYEICVNYRGQLLYKKPVRWLVPSQEQSDIDAA